MQHVDRVEFLKSLEAKKKNAHVNQWMNEAAKHIVQIVELIHQEQEILGDSFPKDQLMFSILENAAEELAVHYTIDLKTGELRSPLVGCV